MTDWSWIDFDLPGAVDEIRNLQPRVASLVADITSPQSRCGTLDWTRAETAAHIIAGIEMYTRWVSGEDESGGDIDNLAASQVALIEERVTERDPVALAERLTTSGESLVTAFASRDPFDVVGWHGDRTQLVGAAAGHILGELLLHGQDLAADAGKRWPITDDASRHVVRANFASMNAFIDADVARRHPRVYAVHVAGVVPARLEFGDHVLRVEPWTGGRATCHVALRPSAWPLVLYGRRSTISQLLSGKAISWGRNPFAAFAMRGYANPEV